MDFDLILIQIEKFIVRNWSWTGNLFYFKLIERKIKINIYAA